MMENENSDQILIDGDIGKTLMAYVTDSNVDTRREFPRLVLMLLRQRPLDEILGQIHNIISAILVISEDQTPNVRSSLVEQIPYLFIFCHEHASPELGYYFYDRLLQIVLQYLQDDDLEVKREAFSSLQNMLIGKCLLDKRQIEETICPFILMSQKISDDVQVLIMSRIAPIIGPKKTEEMFLDRFIELCSCKLNNVKKTCATVMPVMCYVLGTSITETKLLEPFIQLCDDIFWGVRKACAEVIPAISIVCSRECRMEKLSPIVLKLINDTSKWVITSTYKILGEFIASFAEPPITGLAYAFNRELTIVNPAEPHFADVSMSNPELLAIYENYKNIFLRIATPIQNFDNNTTINNEKNIETMNNENLSMEEIAQIIKDNKEKLIEQINDNGGCIKRFNIHLFRSSNDDHHNSNMLTMTPSFEKQKSLCNDETLDNSMYDPITITSQPPPPPPPPLPPAFPETTNTIVNDDNNTGIIATATATAEISSSSEGSDSGDSNIITSNSNENQQMFPVKEKKRMCKSAPPGLSSIINEAVKVQNINLPRDRFDRNITRDKYPKNESTRSLILKKTRERLASELCVQNSGIMNSSRGLGKMNESNFDIETENDLTKEQHDNTWLTIQYDFSNFPNNSSSNNIPTTSNKIVASDNDGGVDDDDDDDDNEDDNECYSKFKREIDGSKDFSMKNVESGSSGCDEDAFTDYNSFKYWHVEPERLIQDDLNELDNLNYEDYIRNIREYVTSNTYYPTSSNCPPPPPPPPLRNTISVGDMETINSNGDDDDVRESSSVNEKLSKFLKMLEVSFEQDKVPPLILEAYVKMILLEVRNEEFNLYCAYSFPAVALTIGKENWHLIKSLLVKLCDDLDYKVRKIIANSIDVLAIIVGKEIATRDLVPIYLEFFKDIDEVKIEAIRSFANFLKAVDQPKYDEILSNIGICLRVDSSKNWRIKEDLAKQIHLLIQMYDSPPMKHDNLLYLTSITWIFLEDKISCVREIAADTLAAIVNISGLKYREAIVKLFIVQEFALSENWRKRQTFLNILYKILAYNESLTYLFRLVIDSVEKLSHDPVPNIRFFVAKILVQLITLEPTILEGVTEQDAVIIEIIKRLRVDEDRDVREISQLIPIYDNEIEDSNVSAEDVHVFDGLLD